MLMRTGCEGEAGDEGEKRWERTGRRGHHAGSG